MTVLSLVLSVSVVACLDQLLSPKHEEVSVTAPLVQQLPPATGEAMLVVRKTGNTPPAVSLVARDTSRGLAAVLIGEPGFDEATRQVTVSIAIRNNSQLRLIEPAAIGVRSDVRALENRATPSSGSLSIVNASDSVRLFNSVASVSHAWRLGKLEPESTRRKWLGRAGLRPKAQSTARVISFQLPPGASRFEIPLVLVATLRVEISAQAPAGSPDSNSSS